jgi:hypothetical protein
VEEGPKVLLYKDKRSFEKKKEEEEEERKKERSKVTN